MVKLFAVGNYMYPKSRYSVGMQMVERLARNSKSGWFKDVYSGCNVSEAGSNVLAIPLTYLVRENVQSLKLVMKSREMSIKDIVVMTYAPELEFGTVRFEEGGPTSGHLALEPIFDALQTEEFWKLRIGISHPANMAYNPDVLLTHEYDEEHYKSFFLCNKFPAIEQFALDQVILPAAQRLFETNESDFTNTYTYNEIIALANRIKQNTIIKDQFDTLKSAQMDELKKHQSTSRPFLNRL